VDAQDSNVVLENEKPAVPLLSQKTWKPSSVPGMSGKVAPTDRNNDMFSSDKEYNVDKGRNAFFAAVQRIHTGLNIKFISRHSVNSTLISDKSKKNGVIK
jgi:hypothetical protein